jgi:hypothetical protein
MSVRALLCLLLLTTVARADVPWPLGEHDGTVQSRIAPPEGFERVTVERGSFAEWLRGLPLRPGRPEVRLHDGRAKRNQEAHFAVLAVDTGQQNLQQCADAVIRLRAEYLRAAGRERELCFRFTSGDAVPWSRWKAGERPFVLKKVFWRPASADDSYSSFREWLDVVFNYAGTQSLARDLKRVSLEELAPGDVFVQGGNPGHAVIVVDVAKAKDGRRVMLLAQSYMPAQEPHVLRRPGHPDTPWIPVTGTESLVTPEWTFKWSELRRFPANACESR